MAIFKFTKDPDEVLDYQIDWHGSEDEQGRSYGDVIDTSEWIVPDGIVKDSDSFSDETTTIWLSGGSLGESYELINRVTTEGGRTYDQTCKVRIKRR